MYPKLALPLLASVQRFTAPTPAGRILTKLVWGSTPTLLTMAFTGSSAAVAIAAVPRWQAVTGGGFVLSGSARSTLLTDLAIDDNFNVRATVQRGDHNVMGILRSTPDGRNCYEAGVYRDGAVTYAVIRRRIEASLVDDSALGLGNECVLNGASGTPSLAGARVNITARVGAADTFTFEARLSGGLLSLLINDEQTPTITHDLANAYTPPADSTTFAPSAGGTTPVYGKLVGLTYAGIASAVSGARVLEAKTGVLTGTRSSRTDLLVAVAGGNVYMIQPDGVVRTVGSQVFTPEAAVQIREFNGEVFMIGGGRARVLDPIRLVVSLYTPRLGTLPGQTTPGTTTARALGQSGTRLVFGGPDEDPQNAWFTAVADAYDLDTGSDLPGAAFTLAGTRPLKIGHPIVGFQEHTNSSLIVLCSSSSHLVMGDPVLGNFDTKVLLDDTGASGASSAVRIEDGRAMFHSPAGLILVAGAEAANITSSTLTVGIQTDRLVDAIVARDPGRHLTWIVLPDQVYAYDERAGGFASGAGGLHPQLIPTRMRTTAAAVWQNKLILGGADGYIYGLDDAATTDDGDAINSFVTLTTGMRSNQTELTVSNLRPTLTGKSGMTKFRIYGARTPEDVIDAKKRKLLMVMDVGPYRNDPHSAKVRAAAVSVVVGPSVSGTTWSIETVEADGAPGRTRSGTVNQ